MWPSQPRKNSEFTRKIMSNCSVSTQYASFYSLEQKHFKFIGEHIQRNKNSECCFWDKKEYPLRLLKLSILDSVNLRESNSRFLSPGSKHLTLQCQEQGVQPTEHRVSFLTQSSHVLLLLFSLLLLHSLYSCFSFLPLLLFLLLFLLSTSSPSSFSSSSSFIFSLPLLLPLHCFLLLLFPLLLILLFLFSSSSHIVFFLLLLLFLLFFFFLILFFS